MKAFNKKNKPKHETKLKYVCYESKGFSQIYKYQLYANRVSFAHGWSERYVKIKLPIKLQEYVAEVIECLKV